MRTLKTLRTLRTLTTLRAASGDSSSLLRAVHVYQSEIQCNTVQSFGIAMLTICVLSLLGLWLVLKEHVAATIPPIHSWELIQIDDRPVAPHQASSAAMRTIQDVSSASHITAQHDTLPMLLHVEPPTLSTGQFVDLSTSSAPNTTLGGSSSHQVANTSMQGGSDVQSPQEEDFSVPPEVEASVNLSEIQSNIVYPPNMLKVGASGEVTVLVIIDETGHAVRASVLESSALGFNDAAVKAVMAGHYTAARNGNKPVASSLAIPIRFHLH